MTPEQFDAYLAIRNADPEITSVGVDEEPGADRTLLYGYSRNYDADTGAESTFTHHVYKEDGLLCLAAYNYRQEVLRAQKATSLPAQFLVPTKRGYSERCDFGFVTLLLGKGFDVALLRPDPKFVESYRSESDGIRFFGLRVEDLKSEGFDGRM